MDAARGAARGVVLEGGLLGLEYAWAYLERVVSLYIARR